MLQAAMDKSVKDKSVKNKSVKVGPVSVPAKLKLVDNNKDKFILKKKKK